MPLPKLNTAPKYELTIPSTGEKVRFRPFLVKEQKVLLLAYESKDTRQIVRAILDTVDACIEDVNVYSLATFDIDYLFTQIRAKSVGETSAIVAYCTSCNSENTVTVNFDNIKVETAEKPPVIQITDEISVKMKYPDYHTLVVDGTMFEADTQSKVIMEIIYASIDSIMTEEENIKVSNESKEELVQFIESMTSQQFEKIAEFVNQLPALRHNLEFKCVSCGHDNNKLLQGIEDFF